jgi:hypothetical protein
VREDLRKRFQVTVPGAFADGYPVGHRERLVCALDGVDIRGEITEVVPVDAPFGAQ